MAVFIGGIGAITREDDPVYNGILERLERDGFAQYDYRKSDGFLADAYPDLNIYSISFYEPKMKDDYKTYKSKYSWAKALTKLLVIRYK